jgi:hypothetical protein
VARRGKSKVWVNYNGLAELRLEALPQMEEHTKRICDEANDTLPEERKGEGPPGYGYNYAVHTGKTRKGAPWVVGRVWTSTNHAKRSNAIHNTLVRLIG